MYFDCHYFLSLGCLGMFENIQLDAELIVDSQRNSELIW